MSKDDFKSNSFINRFLISFKKNRVINSISKNKFLNYWYHLILAYVGALIYCFPSRKIFVLGITGTKGKTTTIELINAALERAGKKTALLSSLRMKINNHSIFNTWGNTMPGRFFIQKFLAKAVAADCEYALVEVTSQGVVSNRHRFIRFQAAAFTNLAPEHIESHGSFENYKMAKLGFFEYAARTGAKVFFINNDDKYALEFSAAAQSKGGKVIFSSKVDLDKDKIKVDNPALIGEFNKENIALAWSVCKFLGVDKNIFIEAMNKFSGTKGRIQLVYDKNFKVFIDYAHTPDSLEKIYQTLKQNYQRPLVCVLGAAGGGRDKWKRKVMGQIAGEYCQKIFLTSEDPYDEDDNKIIEDILSGIASKENVIKILSRQEAICQAIQFAKSINGIAILTGKGSESSIHLKNGKTVAWDEEKAVKNCL